MPIKRPLSLAGALGALGVPLVAMSSNAIAALHRVGEPSVQFSAIGPAGMKIVGTTADLSVSDSGSSVTITVPLANLTTGIGLRDRHMRERYLDVPRHPTAELVALRSSLTTPPAGGHSSGDAVGTLRLHGVEKPVSFHYEAVRDASTHVSGALHIDMRDFGIEVPSYLGVTVKPDVNVTVRFDVADG